MRLKASIELFSTSLQSLRQQSSGNKKRRKGECFLRGSTSLQKVRNSHALKVRSYRGFFFASSSSSKIIAPFKFLKVAYSFFCNLNITAIERSSMRVKTEKPLIFISGDSTQKGTQPRSPELALAGRGFSRGAKNTLRLYMFCDF